MSMDAKKKKPEPKIKVCKVVLLGEAAVGKSSVVLRYIKDIFTGNNEATIGASFLSKTVHLDGDVSRRLEIWDTAGQERFKCIVPMYTRNSQGAVVVYDITKKPTFDRAKQCIKDLRSQAPADCYVVLVGNKLDLEEDRAIQKIEAENYAYETNLPYFECSAKTAENVAEIFANIGKIWELISISVLPHKLHFSAEHAPGSEKEKSQAVDLGNKSEAPKQICCRK